MPNSTTVWMVHGRTSIEGVKGMLNLEDRAIVFVPEGGRSAETVLPVASISRVSRARGTPVLEVAINLPNAPSVIGFYFVQPPPLAHPGGGLKVLDKLVAKRQAVIKLRVGSATKRDEVDLWVSAIRKEQAQADW
jgi:hypothetical protein